jgi:hypothetical protein
LINLTYYKYTRRKMNSFKKMSIALAAALSVATLSAIPTNAAVNADKLSIDTVSSTINTGESATAVITVTFVAQSVNDTVTVTSSVTSLPAGTAKFATLSVQETSSAVVALGAGNYSADVSSTSNTAVEVTAKLKATLDTPSVAGTYVFRFTPSLKAGVLGAIVASPVTWTVTVNAADVKASAATSTSILNAGETNTATADATVYASKALSADAAAVIAVTQKNAAGSSVAESLTAIVTGPGLIGVGSNPTTITAQGRVLTVAAGQNIGVFADGTAGVGTVTIATASGVVLATESVTFYGDIARIVATPIKSVIATGSNSDVISAVAYDAAGVTVGAGTLYATSADLTTVNNSATSATIVNGVAKFPATGVKTGTANVVISNGSTLVSNPVAVRVEGTASTVKLSFDKAKYLPGEAATITVQVVDANGLPLSPKTYSNLFAAGGIVPSYAFGSGSADITPVSVTTDTETVKTYKVFMPLVQNTVKISATGGSSLPVAGQVVVYAEAVVEDSAQKAALDAADSAAKAASEATDAALAAADAADAATTKAQEAVDAVAVLSAQVSKLIASLKAQITTLTNLVIKIQKKVKA